MLQGDELMMRRYFFATLRGACLGFVGAFWGFCSFSSLTIGFSEAGAGSGSGNEAGAGGVEDSVVGVPFRFAK